MDEQKEKLNEIIDLIKSMDTFGEDNVIQTNLNELNERMKQLLDKEENKHNVPLVMNSNSSFALSRIAPFVCLGIVSLAGYATYKYNSYSSKE